MGSLILALIVGVSVWLGSAEYDRRRLDAGRQANVYAGALADKAATLFEGAQVGLQAVEAIAGDRDWSQIESSQELHVQLRSLLQAMPYVRTVGLYDAAGRLRAASAGFPTPPDDISDSETFRSAQGRSAGVFVGPAIAGPVASTPTLMLSRRLASPDGSLRGLVAAVIGVDQLEQSFQQATPPEGSRVELHRGAEPSGAGSLLAAFPRPSPSDPGSGETRRDPTGFTGAHSVGALPLSVRVTLPEDFAAAGWRRWAAALPPLAGGALLAVALLMALALRQAGMDAAARDALVEANRDLTVRIQTHESADREASQARKMQAVGQLAGGLAHDFNNLLTVVMGNADTLVSESFDRPRLLKASQMVISAAERGAELLNRLLAVSRKQPLRPKPLDVGAVVRNITTLLQNSLGAAVAVEIVSADDLWAALVDQTQLEASIVNLALNARDAMPRGGTLTIETANASLDEAYASRRQDVSAGDYVLLSVTDTGAGMSPEVAAQAFEPFFTTKPFGRGGGLGLSMIHGFIKQSAGHIEIQSAPGAGTTVTLYLPRTSDAPEVGAQKATGASPLNGDERILVVEDDTEVLDFTVGALERCGYSVVAFTGATDALERIDAGEAFALLFTDVILGNGMNGPELARSAKARLPMLKVLFTSGHTENALAQQGGLDIGAPLLRKPFRGLDLAMKVRQTLDAETAS